MAYCEGSVGTSTGGVEEMERRLADKFADGIVGV